MSKVFINREQAPKTAFPDADKLKRRELFLDDKQVKEVESLSKYRLDTKLYIVYEGKKAGETLGYAIINTHSLRTMTETVMFVLNASGALRQAEILAFFEPPPSIQLGIIGLCFSIVRVLRIRSDSEEISL